MNIFNEDSLRAGIVSVWGEHGAHIDVFDHMLRLTRQQADGNGVQTPMRLHEAEDWPVSHRTRRVGWLDQRGRVWTEIPAQADRPKDVGSFTPLLIELDDCP